MGFMRYYRRFIQGFSKIPYPITSLQRKGVKFVWCVKSQESFENLKTILTMAMILRVAQPYKYYIVCTNARKEGLRGLLLHEGHVVCYESYKLTDHEWNYVVHDLELEVVVHALNMWHHYLLGKKSLLLTDNTYINLLEFYHLSNIILGSYLRE